MAELRSNRRKRDPGWSVQWQRLPRGFRHLILDSHRWLPSIQQKVRRVLDSHLKFFSTKHFESIGLAEICSNRGARLWPLIVDVDYAEDLATWSAEIYVFATRMREAANTRGAQFFLNCRYVTRPKLYPCPAKSMRIIDCLALYVFGCQVREFNAEGTVVGKRNEQNRI